MVLIGELCLIIANDTIPHMVALASLGMIAIGNLILANDGNFNFLKRGKLWLLHIKE